MKAKNIIIKTIKLFIALAFAAGAINEFVLLNNKNIQSKNIKREIDLTFIDNFIRQPYEEEYKNKVHRILGVKND